MSTTFADGPLASDSEQFGLTRPRNTPPSDEAASPPDIRPWGLRSMRTSTARTDRPPAFYCHARQVALNTVGRPLILTYAADPTANSVTNGDGDEGRSEDWTYDFVPDNTPPV